MGTREAGAGHSSAGAGAWLPPRPHLGEHPTGTRATLHGGWWLAFAAGGVEGGSGSWGGGGSRGLHAHPPVREDLPQLPCRTLGRREVEGWSLGLQDPPQHPRYHLPPKPRADLQLPETFSCSPPEPAGDPPPEKTPAPGPPAPAHARRERRRNLMLVKRSRCFFT